jgi:hypothetical protein
VHSNDPKVKHVSLRLWKKGANLLLSVPGLAPSAQKHTKQYSLAQFGTICLDLAGFGDLVNPSFGNIIVMLHEQAWFCAMMKLFMDWSLFFIKNFPFTLNMEKRTADGRR